MTSTLRTPTRKRRASKATPAARPSSASEPLGRLRRICLALPESTEVAAWGAPTFRVRNKIFAMYEHDHHGSGRTAVWCNATWVNQEALLRARPEEVFHPPYVGPKGWIGIHLAARVDWVFVSDTIGEAYRLTAPKRLLASLENPIDHVKRTAPPANRRSGASKRPPSRGR